jgi:hypothetical protein
LIDQTARANFDSAIPRFESWRPSQPVRSPPLSAGGSRKSARNAGTRRMPPGVRVSDWASLSPSRASVSEADFWYLALGECGIVCRRAESVSILLTDLATCGADQRRRAIMRPSLLGSRAAIGAFVKKVQRANPNAARWSAQTQGIPCSNRLTVRDRGWRPSMVASTMSGAR